MAPLMLRPFVVGVLFCAATTVVFVSTRGGSLRDVDETGSDVTRSTVAENRSVTENRTEAPKRTCPPVDDPTDDDGDRKICRPLLEASQRNSPSLSPSMTTDDLVRLASVDCDCFRSRRGYFAAADTTPQERAFPIAFSLLAYENFEQTERLLRLIYRPHNAYCIHVDRKSSPAMHAGMEAMASCLPNVVIARPAVNVTWGEISVVQAELLCIGYLLAHPGVKWKYFVNLVSRELPLRTNEELVKILNAYDGANDIDGTRKVQFYPEWFQYEWKNYKKTSNRKFPPPHDYVITKGSAHMAATRAFVHHALTDRKAQDLLQWMSNIKIPDEHFFQTLNHNPQHSAPGAFPGDPDSKICNTRAKHWIFNFNKGEKCAGRWIREVCNVAFGDLPWIIASPQMFVNKIRLEDSPTAFRCLELWYRDRVVAGRHLANKSTSSSSLADLGHRFNLSYYSQQPLVQQRGVISTPISTPLFTKPAFVTSLR